MSSWNRQFFVQHVLFPGLAVVLYFGGAIYVLEVLTPGFADSPSLGFVGFLTALTLVVVPSVLVVRLASGDRRVHSERREREERSERAYEAYRKANDVRDSGPQRRRGRP